MCTYLLGRSSVLISLYVRPLPCCVCVCLSVMYSGYMPCRRFTLESGCLEDGDSLREQSHLYSMMDIAWHLCEIIFIELLPPGCLVQQLLEWVCWHSGTYNIALLVKQEVWHFWCWPGLIPFMYIGGSEEEAVQALLATPRPEDDPAYWRTLIWLLLKGKLSEVRDLLSHHSQSQSLPKVSRKWASLLCVCIVNNYR